MANPETNNVHPHPALGDRPITSPQLKSGDGGSTYDSMSNSDINNRLTRLEGGWSTFQYASGIVSAVMVGMMAVLIGAMALLYTAQQATQSDVRELANKIDTLPDKINSNLMELNRTLSQAITATKERPAQVIVVPAPQTQPPAQIAPNP